ncbi:hypothetical protein FACS1894216_06180 [Synergistales bacterium]|nr:hypothetical protein FACS1894216_06180 [Synergistales bacterium]
MQVHHVGYLVKNIEAAISEFQVLGFAADGEITYDPIRDASICFLREGREGKGREGKGREAIALSLSPLAVNPL